MIRTGCGGGATGGAAPAPRPRSMRASRVGTSPRRPQARARTCGVACAAPPVARRRRVPLLLFLAALALARPLAARAADVKLPPVTRVTLENGLRLIVAELHEVPLVEFYVMVGAGSAQDPEGKEGLASLTADVLTRGAGKLSAEEFARTVESLGGTIAADAGTDGTIVSGEFLRDDFQTGLDLLRQVLREPTLAPDEVRRARDAQLADLVAALENPSMVAERCFAAFLYGAYPYGRWQDGNHKSVAGLGRGNVRNFYERWYHPNNTILSVVGDISAEDAAARVREAFGTWEARADAVPSRAGPPEPLTARRVLLVDEPDASQAQIRIGSIAMARNDPQLLRSQVANTVLGGGFSSELVEELRIKRSLTYGASSGFVPRLTGGDFRISTFSKSPTAVEALALALEVAGKFRSDPIDPKALEKAKSYMEGQFPLHLETPESLAARLAEIEFFGLPKDDLATYVSRVAAVTPDDARSAAERHMPGPEEVAIVVVGKAAEIRPALESRFGPVRVVPREACDTLTP
jgi:zinc protease